MNTCESWFQVTILICLPAHTIILHVFSERENYWTNRTSWLICTALSEDFCCVIVLLQMMLFWFFYWETKSVCVMKSGSSVATFAVRKHSIAHTAICRSSSCISCMHGQEKRTISLIKTHVIIYADIKFLAETLVVHAQIHDLQLKLRTCRALSLSL